MLRRVLQVHARPEGQTIEGVRSNEVLTTIAFLGRRRRVYARLVALSGAKPGDRVLDVGCGGGYLARLLAAAVMPAARSPASTPPAPRSSTPGGEPRTTAPLPSAWPKTSTWRTARSTW